ncbi:MAG: hypothetical protein NT128_08150, partial [Proteobacteria bacterium]|nr:hypothetical protein [Pseudomonadota bacterium]
HKLLIIFLMSIFAYLAAAEFDDDINNRNGLALKQYAQALKHAPKALPHHVQLARTDTDALIKAVYYGNLESFIKLIKPKIKLAFNSWLDAMIPGEDDILVFEPEKVANAPVNKSKIALKEAFAKVVDDTPVNTPAPLSASFKLLNETTTNVNLEICNSAEKWLGSLVKGLNPKYTALLNKKDFIMQMYVELCY